jgi:hypothetical protein
MDHVPRRTYLWSISRTRNNSMVCLHETTRSSTSMLEIHETTSQLFSCSRSSGLSHENTKQHRNSLIVPGPSGPTVRGTPLLHETTPQLFSCSRERFRLLGCYIIIHETTSQLFSCSRNLLPRKRQESSVPRNNIATL